jgi:AcrR family transcriptional regulator
MGITERREREKEQRRTDIIDAAERVFFPRGWNAATMEDVAAEAELSKATLYLYFKSKEELYVAILVRGVRILHSMFVEAVQIDASGLRKVESIGRAYVSFYHRYPNYVDAMIHFESRNFGPGEENEYQRERESLKKKTMGLVAQAVQTGIDDGSIRPDIDPMKAAVILWAQTTGLLQILSIASGDIKSHYSLESDDLVETYFDLAFHSLAAASQGETEG